MNRRWSGRSYLLSTNLVAIQSLAITGTNETLTPREVEVLQCIVAGASNKEIADQLVISNWTVKSHVTRILAKLGVSSRTQAAAHARELGLDTP